MIAVPNSCRAQEKVGDLSATQKALHEQLSASLKKDSSDRGVTVLRDRNTPTVCTYTIATFLKRYAQRVNLSDLRTCVAEPHLNRANHES